MKRVLKWFEWMVDNSIYLGCLAVVLMMLTTVFDVSFRFFKHPVQGSIEMTTALMVCVVFFGMGRCTLMDIHLKVDLFKRFPVLDVINKLITLILCLVIGWLTYQQGIFAKTMHSASQLLRIPKYPFVFVAAFGFLLIAVAIIITFSKRSGPVEQQRKESE